MPGHFSTHPGQRSGASFYLSVEERIAFFTLFTYVIGHGHAHPTKSGCLSVNKHYATRILLWVRFLAARNGCKGGIFCRIRLVGRGAGVLGDYLPGLGG